jgi:hypothetical protein
VKTHVVVKSGNAKTGPMAATYRQQASCPTSCPFLNNGCYAGGRIFAISTKYGNHDLDALRALATSPLPNGIRFNVSGDFLTDDGRPDLDYIAACNEVAIAHPGKAKIAYTHAWRILDPSMFAFVVNASCESVEDVEEAVAAGWQAVMVNGVDGTMIGDKPVMTCLAQTQDISCAECKLCSNGVRTRPVVSFIPHGSGATLATVATRQEPLWV